MGCRVQGSACTMPDESIGVCTLHVCGPPSGSPRIQKITVETTDCAGCSPGDEGPTIKIEDVTNNFPTSDTCTTPVREQGVTSWLEIRQCLKKRAWGVVICTKPLSSTV